MADDFDKDELSWLSDDDDDNDNTQDNPKDDLDFDWLKGTDELPPMQNKATKRLGITGDLDWQKAVGDRPDDSTDADDGDSFDWGIFDRAGDNTQTGAQGSGLTGQLPWAQRDSHSADDTPDDSEALPSFDEQVRRAEESAGLAPRDDVDSPGWLSEIDPHALTPIEDEALDEETFNTAWFDGLESDLASVAAETEAEPLADVGDASDDEPETDWLAYMSELDDFDRREAEFFTQAAAESPDDPDDAHEDWLQDFSLEPMADLQDDPIVSESTKVDKPAWLMELEAEAEAKKAEQEAHDNLDALANLFDDTPDSAPVAQPATPDPVPADELDLFGQFTDESNALEGLMDDDESAMFASLFNDDSDSAPLPIPQAEPSEDLFGTLDLLDEDFNTDSAAASESISEPLFNEDAADWLQEIQTLDHAVNQETLPAPEIDDLDSFLASISVDPAPPPASKPLKAAPTDDFEALFADERLAALDLPNDKADDAPDAQQDRPEWLKNVRVEEVSAAALVRKQQDRPLEDLPANLLALREEGQEVPAAGAELAAASVITPLISSASAAARLTDAQRNNAKRLAVLASGEAQDTHQPIRDASRRFPLERLWIAALLIAALIAPHYVPSLRIGDAPPVSFAAGSPQQAVFARIDQLTPGARVLLAAEYSGTGTGELDDLTRVLLAHLAARGANITLTSTTPTGYLHGTQLAQGAALGFDALYIPNSIAGLRTFAQEQERITNTPLDNYALILVIAESADTVRAWAEQIEPQTAAPLAYVTSAAAAPFALPYAQNAGSIGALSGYRDAYAYAAQLEQASGLVPIIRVEATPTPEPVTPAPTTESTPAPTTESTSAPTTESTPAPTTESTPAPTTESTLEPTLAPSVTPQATTALERFAIVTAPQAVNVREGPGTGFAAVGLLQPNDRVRILDENEDGSWYQIEFGPQKQSGWIASFLVTIEIAPGAYRPPLGAQRVGLVSDISQADAVPATDAPVPTLIAGGEDRWYSTTLGLIAAIVVIVVGSVLSLLRQLRKR